MVTRLEKLLISEVSGVDVPANALPGFMVVKAASFKKARELGPDGAWDVDAAEQRIRAATGAEDGPTEAYASCFLWKSEDGVPGAYGDYKFLVCDVVDGVTKVMPAAIRAAADRVEKASVPDTDKAELNSAIAALEKKAGIEKASEGTSQADEQSATSIVAGIRKLLGFAGKDEVDMTKDELDAHLDERFTALSDELVAKLAPAATTETAKAEATAEAAAAEEGVSKDAAEGEQAKAEPEVVAATAAEVKKDETEGEPETPAYLTVETLAEHLGPYNQILEKVLERVEACETSLSTRKSLDGQDGAPEAAEAAEGSEDTVAKAIEKAFRR